MNRVIKNWPKAARLYPLLSCTTFTRKLYDRLRKVLPSDKTIVFHDGFDLLKWEGFFKEREFDNVMLDTHHYLMFGDDPEKENLENYQAHLNRIGEQIKKVSQYVTVVTGEWCLFNQHVAKNQPNMTDDEVTAFYNALWEASVDAWNKGDGYFYWTYKLLIDTVNEPKNVGKDAWDVSRAIVRGWAEV